LDVLCLGNGGRRGRFLGGFWEMWVFISDRGFLGWNGGLLLGCVLCFIGGFVWEIEGILGVLNFTWEVLHCYSIILMLFMGIFTYLNKIIINFNMNMLQTEKVVGFFYFLYSFICYKSYVFLCKIINSLHKFHKFIHNFIPKLENH
jgi:hypothetical protein